MARGQQAEGERTETGADLEHPLAGVEPGRADDATDGVRIVQEVLPERLGRADVEPCRECADVGRTEQRARRTGILTNMIAAETVGGTHVF